MVIGKCRGSRFGRCFDLWHVRNCVHSRSSTYTNVEFGLHVRLVEARKGLPGMSGLKLSGSQKSEMIDEYVREREMTANPNVDGISALL